jgi:hypothetical protein
MNFKNGDIIWVNATSSPFVEQQFDPEYIGPAKFECEVLNNAFSKVRLPLSIGVIPWFHGGRTRKETIVTIHNDCIEEL